ncbi:MAG TPA: aldo/keto reductase [Patescibacteria group bacterium]|nr:aldo/keto reductase [Patescibacteria group bacterium]
MRVTDRRRLGRSAVELTVLGFGGSQVGNLHEPVSDEDAAQAVAAAWALGIRYFDTAPLYAQGLGERRMGRALRGHRRDGYVLSTKVGRLVEPHGVAFDYSHDGVLRSIEDSLRRLDVARIDVALVHDIDPYTHGPDQPRRFREAMEGAYPALDRLRREGVLGAIGVGVNSWHVCQNAVETADFDCVLLAGRYTLLEQAPLASFLPLCERRGIGLIVGAPYNSGILARGTVDGARYNDAAPPREIAQRATALAAVCARHRVSLGAAALQFPLAHPAVASVLPGPRTAAHVEAGVRWLGETIPGDFWRELKALRLLETGAPTP